MRASIAGTRFATRFAGPARRTVRAMALDMSAKVRPATVAIVGRPNVGKSALFNRLVGKRLAIVDDTPGVTRDRLYALAEWHGRTFSVIDTAGIDPTRSAATTWRARPARKPKSRRNDADVIVFVVDAAAGLSPLDDDVVMIMRKTRRPVVLVANKAESERVKAQIPGEFARLGFGEPIAVSALHGEGTGDLLDAIVERLAGQRRAGGRDRTGARDRRPAQRRQVVAAQRAARRRPFDRLRRSGHDARRDRHALPVSRAPDSLDRHGGRVAQDQASRLDRILRVAAFARRDRARDIALLVIDAMQGVLDQDRRLAGMVLEERKGLIIVANKWDLALQQDEDSRKPNSST